MILLHPNLKSLVRICAREDVRYALSALRITEVKDDPHIGYCVEATDAKSAISVRGRNVCLPESYPTCASLALAPKGASEALIPTKVFTKACADVPTNGPNPNLRCVAVVLGANETTLGTTDGESATTRQARNVEGRYPDLKAVMPKGAAKASIMLDAKRLAELLGVLAEFADPDTSYQVVLEVRGPSEPLVMRCQNTEQSAIALIMPLT